MYFNKDQTRSKKNVLLALGLAASAACIGLVSYKQFGEDVIANEVTDLWGSSCSTTINYMNGVKSCTKTCTENGVTTTTHGCDDAGSSTPAWPTGGDWPSNWPSQPDWNTPAQGNGGQGGNDSSPTVAPSLKAFNEIQLKAHNGYRAKHHVGAMTYDASLAAGAQEWAQMMQDTNNMRHSQGSYGENLAMNSRSKPMSETGMATDMWYEELTNPGYNYSLGYRNSGTGHFSQVVWKGSTKLGCGLSSNGQWVCCRYDPPGNMAMPGYYEKNVLPQ